MFTPNIYPQIFFSRETLSATTKFRIRASRYPAKEVPGRLMDIVDVSSDILLGLEAAATALTQAWMGCAISNVD